MTWIAAASLACAAVAFYMGVLALRFGAAPGWQAQRAFAAVALTASAAIAANLVNTLPVPDGAVTWLSRLQIALVLLHIAAWLRFAAAQPGLQGRRDGWLVGAALAGAAAALVPGAVFTDRVTHHRLEPLGVTYADAVVAPSGLLVMAGALALGGVVVARYLRAWWRRLPSAGLVCAAVLALLVIGANDVLVAAGAVQGMYLIDLGFLAPVAAVAWDLTSRFARDARDLRVLRDRLERLVEERTIALERTTRELVASERVAATARLAAGVAHEINNPAAALGTNLRFLAEELRPGRPVPPEAGETLADAAALIERISATVRRLADASRLAGASPRFGAVVALASEARAWASLAGRPAAIEVSPELSVALDAEALGRALTAGLQLVAAEPGASLRLEAHRQGGVVHLSLARSPPGPRAPAEGAAQGDLALAAGLLGIYGGALVVLEDRVVLTLPLADGARG